ncbi:MAG TPA: transporter substrate-binding domain-containing protein, partial [bacterium]|nr:transporter substrate-binding domain-containing protein [bacterium]
MKACSLIRPLLKRRTFIATLALAFGLVTLIGGCIGTSMSEVERDVHIGIYQNAPKVYLDEAGQPAGLFVELAQEIARLEGWRLHYTHCEWEQCLQMLESGEIDLMPDVALNEERDKRFDFHSVSVAHSWSQVYAPSGSSLRNLSDLNQKRVAVLRNSVQESYLRRLMGELGKQIKLIPTDTLEQAFALVANRQADAVACNQFYGERHAPHFKLYETPLIFMPSNLYFAVGKGRNTDLLERIDTHLATWQQDTDSAYFVALKKAMMPAPGFVLPQWAHWALAVGTGLLALFAAVSSLLRWQVNQRTKELRQAAQRLDNVLRASPVVLYTLREDASGVFNTTWVSNNIQKLFGFDAQQALTPGWWLGQLHPDDRPAALAAFRTLSQEGHLTHEYRIIDAQGRVRHVRDEVKYQPKPGGGVATGSWSDLSERYEQTERLSYLLNHDRLTDLANRWLLRD